VPILERAGDRFYSASLLVDPEGKAILHWRKTALWSPGDTEWASVGDLQPAVAETPYGRIGLMIGLEYPTLLPKLAEKKADIVLYSCAFYGVNFEAFLRSRRFLDPIKQGGLYLALANWTVRDSAPWWEGYGMSRIVLPTGLTKRIRADRGDGLVIADVPVPPAASAR
ncbi:MAG: carbon-nitrogen hydrolase family protein, partial [Planctomycetota bacterium]|nr:carbon-nitrogen hydrolase family protein [Planctomycetota bacterium]